MSIQSSIACRILVAHGEVAVSAFGRGGCAALPHLDTEDPPRPAVETAQKTLQPVPHLKRHVALDPRDRAFVAMLPVFRATGGLATGEEVGEKSARRQHDGLSRLARKVAAGEVISFDWQGKLWLPMFQFNHETMEMNEGTRQIVCELTRIMDGWEITQWFATPHAALRNAIPVDMLIAQPEAALNAARLDRFVAQG